jgi:hypothetical protein
VKKKNKSNTNKTWADIAEITPDFILAVYAKAKESKGEQKKILLKVAEVLSEHIGEGITSD